MDPTSFFKSSVANKAGRKVGRVYSPYVLPKGNENAFRAFAKEIFRSSESILSGSVNLDEEWNNLTAEEYANWEIFKGKNKQELKSQFAQLSKAYPSPYCEREAFWGTLTITMEKIVAERDNKGKAIEFHKDDNGQYLMEPTNRFLKPALFPRDYYSLWAPICVFKNEWFWSDVRFEKVIGDDGLVIDKPVDRNEDESFQFERINIKFNDEILKRLKKDMNNLYQGFLETEEGKTGQLMIYIIYICQELSRSEKVKDNKTTYSYYLTMDDYIIVG